MPTTQVSLPSLFNSVTRALTENQAALNEADAYNHNHGDNMVKNFKVITKALKAKPEATPSEQLAYASQVLSEKSQSGSAQLYAQGLSQAARKLEGQRNINAQNAMDLVQALLGGPSSPSSGGPSQGQLRGPSSLSADEPAGPSAPTMPAASGDPLAQLMEGLFQQGGSAPSAPTTDSGDPLAQLMQGLFQQGGSAPSTGSGGSGDLMAQLMEAMQQGGSAPVRQPSQPSQAQSTDILSELMSTFLGGGGSSPAAQPQADQPTGGGIDLGTLLNAGMTYMQAKRQGASSLQAIVQAVMAGSQMNTTQSHAQSGEIVASTLISTIGKLLGGQSGGSRR